MCYNINTLKERRNTYMVEDKYKEYEARKKELQEEDLTPEEYEKRVKELAEELDI